ncbi:MAG: condensation domain-containing protein, partial [Cyanobacteria bacterium P01_H01_bin.121]
MSTKMTPNFYQQLATLSPAQRKLFEQKLAAKGLQTELPQGIPARQTSENLPLSFAQQRLWFVQQLDPNNSAYNVASAFRLQGDLQLNVLKQTLSTLIERHEALRTSFVRTADHQAIQVIQSPEPVQLPLIESLSESELQAWLETWTQEPFDLSQPLLRLALVRFAPQDHLLVLATHHIICDRWSVMVFLRELTLLYRAFLTGTTS